MAPLEWPPLKSRTILAPHVALQLVDRRRLWPPDDVQRNGLVRVAPQAFDFKIAKAGIDRVTQRGRWLRRPLKAEHAFVPGLAGQAVGFLASVCGLFCGGTNRCAVDAFSRLGRHAFSSKGIVHREANCGLLVFSWGQNLLYMVARAPALAQSDRSAEEP